MDRCISELSTGIPAVFLVGASVLDWVARDQTTVFGETEDDRTQRSESRRMMDVSKQDGVLLRPYIVYMYITVGLYEVDQAFVVNVAIGGVISAALSSERAREARVVGLVSDDP